ncbi:MAG: hypothetical protein H8E64_04625 [Candidatus Marinimicrobia bacterium]|nr:hypothetical protein [Candidatus Neomarinimicrobiota bacterium]
MEKIGYIILTTVALAWLIAIFFGMINAFPDGLIGIIIFIGLGLLFIKVLQDRLSNKEDDYYSKTVKK